MLDVASFNEQIEREERLKRLGLFFLSLCALLFIAAVVYLATIIILPVVTFFDYVSSLTM